MLYNIELKLPLGDRTPPTNLVVDAINIYCNKYGRIVMLHDSLYDYRFDTQLSDYHSIDTFDQFGTIEEVTFDEHNVFLHVESDIEIDDNDNYICYFRSSLQSNPKNTSIVFEIRDLFAIDLIKVLDKENNGSLEFSKITKI